jgi:hypothetical protein
MKKIKNVIKIPVTTKAANRRFASGVVVFVNGLCVSFEAERDFCKILANVSEKGVELEFD